MAVYSEHPVSELSTLPFSYGKWLGRERQSKIGWDRSLVINAYISLPLQYSAINSIPTWVFQGFIGGAHIWWSNKYTFLGLHYFNIENSIKLTGCFVCPGGSGVRGPNYGGDSSVVRPGTFIRSFSFSNISDWISGKYISISSSSGSVVGDMYCDIIPFGFW